MKNGTLHTLRAGWLLLTAIAGGIAGLLAFLVCVRAGWPTPVLPLSSLISMGIVAAFTVSLGLQVRRWRNGKRDRGLNPILAARTAVLAQACAYAGALLAGWHLGLMGLLLPDLMAGALAPLGWRCAALIGGGVLMLAIGVMVERFCRIPPEDGTPPEEPKSRERESKAGEEYA
jgi:hypothetical protein